MRATSETFAKSFTGSKGIFGYRLGATEFLGYETETAEGVVTALVRDGKEVAELKAGETGAVIVNQTPFYGESGGQIGDTGVMTADGVRFAVSDTQKEAGDLYAKVLDLRMEHSGPDHEDTVAARDHLEIWRNRAS